MADRNAIMTHVYGAASLLPGFVSIFYSVNANATWREYALVGSGWAAATLFAIVLLFAYKKTREDGEIIGNLNARLNKANDDLANRTATADFLASLLMGKSATPRVSPPQLDGRENAERE